MAPYGGKWRTVMAYYWPLETQNPANGSRLIWPTNSNSGGGAGCDAKSSAHVNDVVRARKEKQERIHTHPPTYIYYLPTFGYIIPQAACALFGQPASAFGRRKKKVPSKKWKLDESERWPPITRIGELLGNANPNASPCEPLSLISAGKAGNGVCESGKQKRLEPCSFERPGSTTAHFVPNWCRSVEESSINGPKSIIVSSYRRLNAHSRGDCGTSYCFWLACPVVEKVAKLVGLYRPVVA